MDKVKKIRVLALVAILALFASCECLCPVEEPTPAPVVTTTTIQAAAPVVAATPITPPATTATTVQAAIVPPQTAPVVIAALPSIGESDLRSLYGRTSLLRNEAESYGIASVLPGEYAAADEEFSSASAHYDAVIETIPYDGAAAYPVKAKLEASAATMEKLIADGLPLRVEAERDNALDFKFQALGAEAPALAADRFASAEDLYSQAEGLEDSGELAVALPAYKQAALGYELSLEKAKANSQREEIFSNGYAKYSPSYFEMAETSFAAEEESWNSGADLASGVAALKDANAYYSEVANRGVEYKAYEAKDGAAAAKAKADGLDAALNAPESYASALDILAEADANHEAGSYGSSAIWYGDAADAFYAAHDDALALQTGASDACDAADAAVLASTEKAAAEGLESNVYLSSAAEYRDKARAELEAIRFNDAIADAEEAMNLASLSDAFVDGKIAENLADENARLAAAKADADPAMADARARMAWADSANIKTPYSAEYRTASSAMTAAEMAYSNERYMPARTLAEEVSATLSDDFQARVAADRALAADKAYADTAMADARARMAWAEAAGIKNDYPAEYRTASSAMTAAGMAYSNERYVPARTLAEEVSATLSGDFQAKVAADRAATAAEKARLAALEAEKALADPEMNDARARMAWADASDIKTGYPAEYRTASSAMTAAEMAYSNERYMPAKTLAEEVSATLSDDFQAKVAADRAAALVKADADAAKLAADAKAKADAQKAAELAAIKTTAAVDIAKAEGKLAWAKAKNGMNNYPAPFYKGAGELDAAKFAYDRGAYAEASAKAKASFDSLSGIAEFAPLPASYKVRLIPERRDCLWRIAEYSFVYNNPLKWKVLYEANKKTFRDPSNPDLIFPGQVLAIPSINGETRQGAWDPMKTYISFGK